MKDVERNVTIDAISMIRRPGTSVRTTAQARNVPVTVATSATPVAMMSVLRMAQ